MQKFKTIGLFLFFIVSCSVEKQPSDEQKNNSSDKSPETAQYKITFVSGWSEETFPTDFPSNPHYSKLVGSSHNSNYTLWKEGTKATEGFKEVAETGGVTKITEELESAKSSGLVYAFTVAEGGIPSSPGQGEITVTVHKKFPLLSIVTMIAPSPDWFVGFYDLKLQNEGEWITTKTLEANPWDAGTDGGLTYTSDNDPLDPPVNIFPITSSPFPLQDEKPSSLGSFIVEKI